MKNRIDMATLLTQISLIAETNFGIVIPPDLLRWLIGFTAAQVLFFAYVAFAVWKSKSDDKAPEADEQNDQSTPNE